jgi:hypothetical protein
MNEGNIAHELGQKKDITMIHTLNTNMITEETHITIDETNIVTEQTHLENGAEYTPDISAERV